MGGVAIEVMRDFALRMLPLRDGDAEAMIAETRGAAFFGAVRGHPASDVKSLARVFMHSPISPGIMPLRLPKSISIPSRCSPKTAAAS